MRHLETAQAGEETAFAPPALVLTCLGPNENQPFHFQVVHGLHTNEKKPRNELRGLINLK